MTVVLLEALTFGLGRLSDATSRAGHRLVLLTGNRPIYSYELSRLGPDDITVVDVDTTDVAACDAALRAIPDLAGLINSTDTWARPGAELAERFGLPTVGAETVRTLRDKGVVRRLLHQDGLSRAPAITVERTPDAVADAARTLRMPFILKDSAGTSSRAVWLVRDERELRRASAAVLDAQLFGHLIAEPYFPGFVYSAETLTWNGRTRLLGLGSHVLTPEPLRREEAVAFPVAMPDDDVVELEKWISRVLATVGFSQGVAHTELALTVDGPEVIEINGRIGGALIGEAMCRSLGTDVYEAMVSVALGERPRLLDDDLVPGAGPGMAMAFLHPARPGLLRGWEGLDRLPAFPGNPEWYPAKSPGDRMEHLADQRGCTGFVLAEGPSTEVALYNALTAAGTVTHRMEPLDGPAVVGPGTEAT